MLLKRAIRDCRYCRYSATATQTVQCKEGCSAKLYIHDPVHEHTTCCITIDPGEADGADQGNFQREMGAGSSSQLKRHEEELLARLTGPNETSYNDVYWKQLFSVDVCLPGTDPEIVEARLSPYTADLGGLGGLG